MVHALKEAWRILVPHGMLIDVRPLSIDAPLEVVYEGGKDSAGMVDMSPGMHEDQASNQAIASVVSDQLFRQLHVEHFDFNLYWTTVEGMQEDIQENWQGEVNISEETWQHARELFNLGRPKTQLRVPNQMQLGSYIKNP